MTGDPCRCEWLSVVDSFGQLPELLAEKPDGRRAARLAGFAVPQLLSAPPDRKRPGGGRTSHQLRVPNGCL